jgi:hypothetical protein
VYQYRFRARDRCPRTNTTDWSATKSAVVQFATPSSFSSHWEIVYMAGGETDILFGDAEACPSPGDYDDDGLADLAVYKNGAWWLLLSASGVFSTNWPLGDGVAVSRDYDADGPPELAVYRPVNGQWTIRKLDGTPVIESLVWGFPGTAPAPADYNGADGCDLCVYDDNSGGWCAFSLGGWMTSTSGWGTASELAVPGDYDGDGTWEFGLYATNSGIWRTAEPGSGDTDGWQLGGNGAIPAPAR